MKNFYRVNSILLVLICSFSVTAAEVFETFDVLKAYAKDHPEIVPLDNQDYLNPEYVKYLDNQVPDAWGKILMAVGLKRRSTWQPKPFLELLRRVTEKRKKDGMQGKFLQRQEVSQEDHFLVWGNLQGAYHSLVYTIEHLIEEKILDKNLKVIKPKYFLVFCGNVIDRSVYSLETLTIVLRLLDANPMRVFYVRGNHETDLLWQEYDFRDELIAKVAKMQDLYPPYPDNKVPFTDDINAFFDTLPQALYLGMKTVDSANGIRISHFTRNDIQLEYDELKYILNAVNTTLFPMPMAMPKERADEIDGEILAMTEGSSDLIPDYNAQGLRLLPPDQGTTAWSILSAASETYQKLYKFVTDSYVDITIALPMKKTTITQHYQDVSKRTGFKTGRVYNMYSGQSDEQFRAQAKVDTMRVGLTLDLEGETAVLGLQIRNGLSLAINKQNQQGIVSGLIMLLIMMNDNHELAKARRNVETLVNDIETSILLGIDESVMAERYLDLIKAKNILVLFPFTGVAKLRTAENTNIIHYGPSYTHEANISTRYILETVTPNKIAIFYEKGQMGEDALVGVKAACKEKGFTAIVEVPFKSNLLNFKEQIAQIQRENPDVLGIFSSSPIGQEFIRQIGVENLGQRTLYALSSFGSQSFRQFYQSKGLQIITTNLVPDPFKSDLPIVQDFRKEAQDNNVIVSPQILEAYIGASIFVEAARITRGAINKESIKETLESMNQYDFKGLMLTFNKTSRRMSSAVWLDIGDGSEWKKYVVDKEDASAGAPNTKKNGKAQDGAAVAKQVAPQTKKEKPMASETAPIAARVIEPVDEHKEAAQ